MAVEKQALGEESHAAFPSSLEFNLLAMHGVKRSTAPTASAKAARKEKEAAQLKTYLEVEAAFFEAVSERSEGALQSSASAY